MYYYKKISYNRLDIDINNDKPYFLLILWSIINAVLFATNMRYNTITYAKKKTQILLVTQSIID